MYIFFIFLFSRYQISHVRHISVKTPSTYSNGEENTKNSGSRNTDSFEAPVETMDWIATNLLNSRDSHHTDMKVEKLEEVKLLFRSHVDVVVPDPFVRANSYRKNWVCFYYYPYDIGLTFPFFPFIADVLKTLNISPGQHMPFAWRTLVFLDSIEEKHQFNINVEVVKHSYSLKKFSGCRIEFVNKNTEDPLILNNETVNDTNWKKFYFFVDNNSLGDNMDHLLDRWNNAGISLVP